MCLLQVTRYLGYSSLTDFFPTMEIKPNPTCSNPLCRNRQSSYLEKYNSPAAVEARLVTIYPSFLSSTSPTYPAA